MLAGAALVAPAVTEATTLEELSLSAMVRQAEVIVTGTCERVESRWVGRTLYTLATVRVAETLKGEARRELTLVVPGGMDLKRPIPIAVTYPGAPVVMQGQGLVLLLEPFAEVADGFAAVGFSQGALPVMRDEAGRSLVLRRGASAGGAVPLSALRSEILSYLEEQR
jgi:hypothetical protein